MSSNDSENRAEGFREPGAQDNTSDAGSSSGGGIFDSLVKGVQGIVQGVDKAREESQTDTQPASDSSLGAGGQGIGGAVVSGVSSDTQPTSETTSVESDQPVYDYSDVVGTGGVGSTEYMDALRRGHEEAGGEYASDLGSDQGTGTGTDQGSTAV